jgi:OMF family outer membrane factor
MLSMTSLQAQTWTLQACKDTLTRRNKNLKIIHNNRQAVLLKMEEVKTMRYPKLIIAADYRYFGNLPYQLMPLSVFNGPEGKFKEAQFGVPHNMTTNFQVQLPVFNPQTQSAIESSKYAEEMTELQFRKLEEQLLFDISLLYFNAQILHKQAALLDSNLADNAQIAANVKLLHEQGLAKSTDVEKIEWQAEQLRAQKVNVRSKIEQIFNNMKLLMSLPQDAEFRIDETINLPEKKNYTENPLPDLMMLQTQKSICETEKKSFRLAKLPIINFTANYGYTGFAYDKSPNEFLKFFPTSFIGLQLSYSLWNPALKKKAAQKEIDLKNNFLQTEFQTEQIATQLKNAYLQRDAAEANIKSYARQTALAEKIYAQTRLQIKHGTANLTDVLTAHFSLREARQFYLNALTEYLKTELEIQKFSGNISQN